MTSQSQTIPLPKSADVAGIGVACGGMLALAAGMGIGRFVYTPILPDMAASLGLTQSAAGLIAAANFLGYLAGAVLAAAPNLPGGRRRWFLGGLAASAATTAAMALASGLVAFMALRFAGGIASAFVLVLGSALVLDRLAAFGRPGRASLHFAGVGVGIAASSLLVDALHGAGADWRTLWLASGALSGLAVLLAGRLVPEAQPAAAVASATIQEERRPRGLALLTLCHGLFGFGYVVTATFLVAVVHGGLQARALEAVVWLVVGLTAAPSTAAWGMFSQRYGAFRAYGIACALLSIGVAAGGAWPTPVGALLSAVLLGGTFMGITALGFAAARELAPRHQRRSFALITAGFGLGQVLGPVVAGVLLDRTGAFAMPSLIATAATATAAIIAMRLART